MFPEWLNTLSIIWISLACLSALIIYIDIKLYRPQAMSIMAYAWPINALYFSIIALVFYFWFGRANQKIILNGMSHSHHNMHHSMPTVITWKNIFKTSTHCGAGCTLADIIGEVIVLFIPVIIFGSFIYRSWLLDFVLALIIGIYFQYLPGREMGFGKIEALKKAIQADLLSVIAWQVGMYIWMGLVFFVFFTPEISRMTAVYWFMMQIAMICGFMTAYPMNWYLAKKGIKHVM